MSDGSQDEYKGSGKLFSTLAGAGIGAITGEAITEIPKAYKAIKSGEKFDAKNILEIESKTSSKVAALAGAIAVGAIGYMKSSNAKEQFADMVNQRDEAVSAKDVMTAQMNHAEKFGNKDKSHSEKASREKDEANAEELSV